MFVRGRRFTDTPFAQPAELVLWQSRHWLQMQRKTAIRPLRSFFQNAAKVRFPPMLLKKSLLQRGKSFDSLEYEGIGGFRHDGHPNGTGAAVL